MQQPRLPSNEKARLQHLLALKILDTAPEERFDNITQLASDIFSKPVALITLVSEDRQWFKSRCGFDAEESSREVSLCGHVVGEGKAMVVPDARQDERFADNPLVTAEKQPVVFYAGAPLRTKEGLVLGSLCLIDHKASEFSAAQLSQLERLAKLVMDELDLRSLLHKSKKMELKLATKSRQATQRSEKLLELISRFKNTRSRLINAEKIATLGLLAAGTGPQAVETIAQGRKLLLQAMEQIDDERGKGLISQSMDQLDEVRRLMDALCETNDTGRSNEFKETDVNELLRLCRHIIMSRFDGKVRFVLDAAEDLPHLRLVESQVSMALLNVLLNAAESTPGQVTIRAQTYVKSEHLVVRIMDNGDGMSEEVLQRVTDAFFSSNKDDTHSGLGLSIAQGIVKDHGGVLRLHSEEGKGSRVTIAFPLTTAGFAQARK
ncbi:ATP-binding protein [Aliidiomarina sp. Khilg15.8]